MIAPVILLAGTSLALSQPTSQPYFLEKASSAMVNYAVKYRATGVSENQASSAANEIVSSLLSPPEATEFVSAAASYYANNGPKITGSQALSLANEASSYYDEIRTRPAYTNFASLVQKDRSLFDLNRGINDVQAKVLKVGSVSPNTANKIADKVVSSYDQLKSDPAGSQAIAQVKALGRRVASDFNVNSERVKSRISAAKNNFVNMLLGN